MLKDKNETYRHELKYRISLADYYAIRQRLRPVMKPDEHTRADGRYVIRSIYFDNVHDKALREKINGVQKREKFRIRYYNDWDDDYDTGTFYMPDVQFQYGGLYHGAPMYLPIRLAAIEY